MKTLSLIVMAMSLISTIASSQSKEEKEVAAAVEKLRKAMIDADGTALKELAAEDLTYGHSSGKVEDKDAFVSSIVNGDSDFVTLDLSEQTIKIVDNTAIVRHKFVGETMDKGKPGNPKLYVLLVLQKQNGKWQLRARQAVKIQ
jgi:ketosteroid isomerase-like protein